MTFSTYPGLHSHVNRGVLRPRPGGLSVKPHLCGRLTAVPESRAFSQLPMVRLRMIGPWFTSPWQMVSRSHRAVAWRFLLTNLPCSDQIGTPRFPVLFCHIPSLVQFPRRVS